MYIDALIIRRIGLSLFLSHLACESGGLPKNITSGSLSFFFGSGYWCVCVWFCFGRERERIAMMGFWRSEKVLSSVKNVVMIMVT